MGNSCCCSNNPQMCGTYQSGSMKQLPVLKKAQMEKLIRLQAVCRAFVARKRLQKVKETKIRSLFGKETVK